MHPADMNPEPHNPRSPYYVEPASVLDCPNETGTWLAENMEEPITTAAIESIGDYLAGPRDNFAERKLLREMLELADTCGAAIAKHEDLERRAAA